jgi:hypothetical protein
MVTGVRILTQLVPRSGGDLPPEIARYVLDLDFPQAVHERHEELSYKAQDGSLSPEERAELEEMIAADTLLSIMQSKARSVLKKHSPAA